MDRFPSCCKSVNLENMVISDSNPMQNLRKSMQKVKKKKVLSWKTFNETFYEVKYFARRSKYICDSILFCPRKIELSWQYGYMGLCVLYGLGSSGRATLQITAKSPIVIKTLSIRLLHHSGEPWTGY